MQVETIYHLKHHLTYWERKELVHMRYCRFWAQKKSLVRPYKVVCWLLSNVSAKQYLLPALVTCTFGWTAWPTASCHCIVDIYIYIYWIDVPFGYTCVAFVLPTGYTILTLHCMLSHLAAHNIIHVMPLIWQSACVATQCAQTEPYGYNGSLSTWLQLEKSLVATNWAMWLHAEPCGYTLSHMATLVGCTFVHSAWLHAICLVAFANAIGIESSWYWMFYVICSIVPRTPAFPIVVDLNHVDFGGYHQRDQWCGWAHWCQA